MATNYWTPGYPGVGHDSDYCFQTTFWKLQQTLRISRRYIWQSWPMKRAGLTNLKNALLTWRVRGMLLSRRRSPNDEGYLFVAKCTKWDICRHSLALSLALSILCGPSDSERRHQFISSQWCFLLINHRIATIIFDCNRFNCPYIFQTHFSNQASINFNVRSE